MQNEFCLGFMVGHENIKRTRNFSKKSGNTQISGYDYIDASGYGVY